MRFMIIAQRRTGSSHLVNTLGGHPEILCHGNIFARGQPHVFWTKNQIPGRKKLDAIKMELSQLREGDPKGFLRRVYGMDCGRPHVGFKIFPHENNKMLRQVIADSSIRKIVLHRENVLASYASQEAAADSGKWGLKKGEVGQPAPRVPFVEEEFIKYYEKHAEYYSTVLTRLANLGQTFALIRYTEINDPLLLRGVLNFIGADPLKPVVEEEQHKVQVKQNSSNILSRFSNADDVGLFLAKNNLESWAQEGQTRIVPWRQRIAEVTCTPSPAGGVISRSAATRKPPANPGGAAASATRPVGAALAAGLV